MEKLYYITQWTDEVMPCQVTLAGWAEWLSKPDEDYGRKSPAAHGEQYAASVMQRHGDIVATFRGGAWRCDFSPAPNADWWMVVGDPEQSHDDFAALLECLESEADGAQEGDETPIAQYQHLPGEVVLEYRVDPATGPTLIEIGRPA